MKRLLAVVLVAVVLALALVAFVLIYPSNPPGLAPGYHSAEHYATLCGGRVTDPLGVRGGPYVVGCDR